MKRNFLIIVAAVVALSAQAQQMQELPNDPAVRVGVLENGMTYYIRHNEKPAQRAEFYLASNVGAIQENPEQDGLAHFLEHMCFNGTKNLPGKTMLEYLQKIGASFGRNINAMTAAESTQYMLNNIPMVREGILDTCLLIMHDYSHFVTCDPVEIDAERGVIMEEKRSRNNAAWRNYEKQMSYLYKGSKYDGCTVIGSFENLESFKPETLVDFYHTWYRPDMQAVIVVGDVDVDQVEAKIKALFADIPAVENPEPKVMPVVPDNDEPIVGIITDPETTQTSVEVYWKIPQATIPIPYRGTDVAYMQQLVKVLIHYVMAERLNDIVVLPDAPFSTAQFGVMDFVQTSDAIYTAARCEEGGSLAALAALLTEVEKMQRYGFTEEEVERAKAKVLSRAERAVEAAESRQNADFINEIIANFLTNDPYLEPSFELMLLQQLCQFVNAEVLSGAAAELIPQNNMVVLCQGPEKAGLVYPTEAQVLEVIAAVKASEIEANAAEQAHEALLDPSTLKGSAVKSESKGLYDSTIWELKNGVKVVVLPTELKKDEVLIRLWREGGESLIAQQDLASFELNVFSQFNQNTGLSKFSKPTLNKMLAGNTASVGLSVNALNHGLIASAAPKDLETAFQLLYLRYTDARFDEDEFNQGIKRLASIVPNYLKTPGYVRSSNIQDAIYGENPRRQVISMDLLDQASVKTIERVYNEVLFPSAAGTTVIIVGNVNLETLKPMVELYLGALPKGKKASQPIVENFVERIPGQRSVKVQTPMEMPMTSVYMAWTADVLYDAFIDVASDVLDYIMDMVYVDTLREGEGGTYSPSTSVSINREPYAQALVQVSFDTNGDQAEKLIEIAISEFEKIATQGPSEEYFNRAIENLKKNIPEYRISNSYWANMLRNALQYGGENADWSYEMAVSNITIEDIKALAKTLVESGNYVQVVVEPTIAE